MVIGMLIEVGSIWLMDQNPKKHVKVVALGTEFAPKVTIISVHPDGTPVAGAVPRRTVSKRFGARHGYRFVRGIEP